MDSYNSSQSQPNIYHRNSHINGDVLGNEGRKALDACVKVKIYGPPETRRYHRVTALERLISCYRYGTKMSDKLRGIISDEYNEHKLPTQFLEEWSDISKTYDIVDIRDALVTFDDISYVEKYPKEGPGFEKIRELIDKRRADVERELEEATANPDSRQRYSWTVAQRCVRDCYAGNFPWDSLTTRLTKCKYDIRNIHPVLKSHDEDSLETCSYQCENKSMYEKISAHRVSVENEYEEAVASSGTLRKYTREEADQRLRGCYCGTDGPSCIPDRELYDCYIGHGRDPYITIFDIHSLLRSGDGTLMPRLHKYPEEGPGSEELKNLIDRNRADLETEYQNFVKGDQPKLPVCEYSPSEAMRRVRDCFAGNFSGDTDMFPTKKDQSGLPKIYQTFDIFDIKQSIDYFDTKKLLEKYPEKVYKYDEGKQHVDEQRASIQSEYEIATTNVEIEHGSGFIIHDHFILTNKHVIETYLGERDSYEIRISNACIGELSCRVIHTDPGKDLALLYCPDLNLQESGICPLQLSNQPLLPGMHVFCFGYPISHMEETALFINGNVSGFKKTLYDPSLVVMNCALNSGNSGGPVLSWVNGEIKVVGIATQKHFKDILTLDERMAINKIRKSLQTHAIPDVPSYAEEELSFHSHLNTLFSAACQASMNLLTLKLYDALETHSQFNLSNALPAHLVVEFIKNSITEYEGECKEELDEIVKLSQ